MSSASDVGAISMVTVTSAPDRSAAKGGRLRKEDFAPGRPYDGFFDTEQIFLIAGPRDVLLVSSPCYVGISGVARLLDIELTAVPEHEDGFRCADLGSFSKTAFPGARVGFAVADQTVTDSSGRTGLLADDLSKIKSMVTVNTSPLSQAAVAGMLLACNGRLSELNAKTSAYYANAMRSTLRQLDQCFPSDQRAALGVRWNEPDGGFFLTMRVLFRADNAALARAAEDFGIIWTPMSYFYPHGGGDHSIRLSVSYRRTRDSSHRQCAFRFRLARVSLATRRGRLIDMTTATPCFRSKPRRWGWTYR